MKLKAKLPKDDADGISTFETELTSNLMDIEGVPEEQRSHLLDVMSAIKSDRMNQGGRTPLEMPADEIDHSALDASDYEPVDIDDPDGAL